MSEIDIKDILRLYRDPKIARRLAFKIRDISKDLEDVLIMHVCGTHEWTITHYGIRSLLPDNLELRAGPGCPVCITPASDIDNIIKLGMEGVVVTVYGDMSRAKGGKGMSLEEARSRGADIRIVYGIQDAFMMAQRDPSHKYVFFGVGFDTTAPATAYMVKKGVPDNLSILSSYRYVPPAVGALMMAPDLAVDGIINPGHSSTVTGMKPYKEYFDRNKKPMVFAGFEPIDVLLAIYMILKQIKTKEYKMENEYTRSVTWDGNVKAMETLLEVFLLSEGYWRGFGVVDKSGFVFRNTHKYVDARYIYGLSEPRDKEDFVAGARCADVIKGKIDPVECPLYMKECTPNYPRGPPMVSIEGTCKIWADHKVTGIIKCRF
jgi:hydrogenase expression/formation protein HypD